MQSGMMRRIAALPTWKKSAALSRRDQAIARLDEQGASKERVGGYRWPGGFGLWGMVVVMMMAMSEGGLMGCAITRPSGQKAITNSKMGERIVVGVTTKGEVRALLGEPGWVESVTGKEEMEMWFYRDVATGGVIMISFTKDGVVKAKGYGGSRLP